MAESTTTTTPSDDVVGEILLRVDDLATLFRCATTCKRWRRLVAKPYFLLRRQWPPPLVGFFFTKRCHGTRSPGMFVTETAGSSSELVFVPLPGSSLLGTRPRALSSFIHAHDAAAAADGGVPLATRGGLLLVRLYLREDDDMKRKSFSFEPVCNPTVGLAVCNLLAGTWEVLPELKCQSKFGYSDKYGFEIIVGDGDGSSAPAFKVLMIGADKDKAQFNLHTYASGEASWRAPTMCFDMMERQTWLMEHQEAVVCGGYAHWLFLSSSGHFHVLHVNVETGHVSLTELRSPTKDRHSILSRRFWGAGRLATTRDGTSLTLCRYNGSRLEVWAQHQEDGDGGDEGWVRTGEIDHNLTELIQQFALASCVWSGGRSGAMLIAESYRTHIAHLDTGTLEEITDQFPTGRARQGIVPMEMEIDWPTFFMLRLGGS